MNFSDLLVVIGLLSSLYGVLVAMTNRQQFLLKAVNPHRLTWLITALSVLWVGLSLMRWEAGSWGVHDWVPLLRQLVSEAPTSGRVKVASLALLFGILLCTLVSYCVLFYPRDPSTFRRPQDRRAAIRYYVHALRGGLDFAQLRMGDGEVLEESASLKQIEAWCVNLPKVAGAAVPPPPGRTTSAGRATEDDPVVRERLQGRLRTAEDQVAFWRKAASRIHERMRELDALIGVANQGHNRRLVFDCEFGGMFFRYLRLPDPTSEVDTGLYLFGATLNQTEMTSGRAEQHFQMLLEAMNYIDRAVRVA
ncbi:MAG: hypothetical protein ACRC33_13130 [Gemmataceae bacterium]